MPPNLPGFYFDEERGRYFRLAPGVNPSHNGRELKKRKIKEENKIDAKSLFARRRAIFQQYICQLLDPFQRVFGPSTAAPFIEGLRIEDNLLLGSDVHDTRINRAFGTNLCHHQITHIVCEKIHSSELQLMFSTQNGHLGVYFERFHPINENNTQELVIDDHSPRALEEDPNLPDRNDRFFTVRLEGTTPHGNRLYCHMVDELMMKHLFVRLGENLKVENIKKIDQHKFRYNVNDSVDLGEYFIVADGPCLVGISWDPAVKKIATINRVSNEKSDIICLALSRGKDWPTYVYAGYRNGSVSMIPLKTGNQLDLSSEKRYRLPGVRTILSIKTSVYEGIIFVSAISEASQALYMIDMNLDSRSCIVATFKTSFSNMTREQEIFEVTSDGRFLLYGSSAGRDGLGDIEVFSSHLADNIVHKRSEKENEKSIIFFALRTLNEDILKEVDLGDGRLRAITFGNYRQDMVNENQLVEVHPYNSDDFSFDENSHRLVMIFESESIPTSFFLPRMTLVTTSVV